MKRLLMITGALLIAYVVMMGVFAPSAVLSGEQTSAAAVKESDEGEIYTVIDENGRVAVLLNGAEYLRTDTVVAMLPKSDQLRLKEGITVYDTASLKRLLEDYCS